MNKKRRPQSRDSKESVEGETSGLHDPHARSVAESVSRHLEIMEKLAKHDAPLDEVDRLISLELSGLTTKLKQHRSERVIELARLGLLRG